MDKTPTDKQSSGETPNSGRGERKSSGGAKIASIKVRLVSWPHVIFLCFPASSLVALVKLLRFG